MPAPHLILLLQVSALLSPKPAERHGPLGSWHPAAGFMLGASFAPAEIGRDTNATGGEQLVAHLGDAVVLGLRGAVESDVLGLELVLLLGAKRVEVENELGVRFPNHGQPPVLWTGSLLLYPLFALRNTALGRRVRPFVVVGVGGAIVSVDLDNIKGQTLYHSWQGSVGGGIRFFSGRDRGPYEHDPFVELRLVRHRVRQNGPLYGFDILAATVGLGMRL